MTNSTKAISARSEFLPFSPPAIDEREVEAVVDALRSGWITTGPRTKKFEREFADYHKVPDALAVNSCTAALHTALVAAGVGPGDEVITTTITFAASVNVIEHVGAHPVLVDVQPDTLNLDPVQVSRAVTPRTRAIIPVHFGGHPVDLDEICDIASGAKALVLEDAAHAIGARYRGQLIGGRGNPTAYSFYATKNLTTGEGGMLTGSPELLETARVIALHGMSKDAFRRYEKGGSWFYEIVAPGFKYNMTDIQAAMGLVQLGKLADLQARRTALSRRYADALGSHPAFELPEERAYVTHAWHLYPIRLRLEALRIDRDQVARELTARNIGHSVHFIPIHLHPYYRDKYGYAPGDFPIALANYMRLISLPLHPGMTDQDVDDVVNALIDIVESFAR